MLSLLIVLATFAHATIWPQPQSMIFAGGSVTTCPSFQFLSMQPNPIVNRAFQRYQQLIFGTESRKAASNQRRTVCLESLVVSMQSPAIVTVDPFIDESYSLDVHAESSNATLKANTFVGVLRGLETFSQIFGSPNATATIAAVSIVDSPRFPWRGIMIDTARHYLPLATMLHVLDAMVIVLSLSSRLLIVKCTFHY
jgi:hexosaminidase